MEPSSADYEEVPFSEENQQLPDSSVVLDLSKLAENYAHCVPFRFQVINGFMAENEKDPTLGVDEVYSVHLVREIKVVNVKLESDKFKIPISSAVKVGLVPPGGAVVYKSVEDILSAPNLPKVVAVMNKYINAEESLSLRKNEVLLVRGVVKGKFGRGKTALRVFSISSYGELVLPKNCNANFSTDPSHTQLYLTDLIDNEVDFIPGSARIYPNEGSLLATFLTIDDITIESLEVQRSVIVSLFRDNPNAKSKKETSFIDIPTTIDINVSIIKTDKSDEIYERIYKESEHLLADYNPSKIQACVDASTNDEYMTQAQLLAEIRKEKAAMELANSAPHQYQKLLTPQRDQITNYESVTVPSLPAKQQPILATSPPLPPLPAVPNAFDKPKAKIPAPPGTSQKHSRESFSSRKGIQEAVHRPALIAKPVPEFKPVRPPKAKVNRPPLLPKKPSSTESDVYKDTVVVAPSQVISQEVNLITPRPPPKRAGKGVPSSPKNHADHLYEDTVHIAASFSPEVINSSPKPVPSKRTGKGVSYSPIKRVDHLYEDLGSISPSLTKSPAGQRKSEHGVHSQAAILSGEEAQSSSSPAPTPRPPLHPLRSKPLHQRGSEPETSSISSTSSGDTYVKFTKSEQESSDQNGHSEGSKVVGQLNEIQTLLSDIVNRLGKFEERQSNFEADLRELKAAAPNRDAEGIIINSSMSPAEVLKALDAIGLSQYRESFSREVVDGEMFMMLDEAMLSDELGVKSRLHQVRLLKMKAKD